MGIIGHSEEVATKMYDHINRHQKGKNMQVQTEAILFNVATVHSTKKNKDYNTLDFILDGVPKKFFVSDEVFNSFLVNPVVKRFQEQGRNPLQCKVCLSFQFSGNRIFVNLEDIAGK